MALAPSVRHVRPCYCLATNRWDYAPPGLSMAACLGCPGSAKPTAQSTRNWLDPWRRTPIPSRNCRQVCRPTAWRWRCPMRCQRICKTEVLFTNIERGILYVIEWWNLHKCRHGAAFGWRCPWGQHHVHRRKRHTAANTFTNAHCDHSDVVDFCRQRGQQCAHHVYGDRKEHNPFGG